MCAGVAQYFNLDVTLVRLVWVILSIVPGALIGGVIAYAIAWVLMPEVGAGERTAYTGRQLVRSYSDQRIAGVCGGMAEYLEIDATLVRLAALVLAVYPGAVIGGILAYGIAWVIIPRASTPHLRPAASAV